MKTATKFTILFSSTLIFAYLLYPFWLLVNSFKTRVILFSFFVLYVLVSTLILNKWFKNNLKEEKNNLFDWNLKFLYEKYNLYLLIFIILAIISISYALTFPIMTFEDESAHIYRGMYPVNAVASIFNSYSPIPFQVICWILLLGSLFLTYYLIKINPKLKYRLIDFIYNKRTYFVIFGILFSFLYFFIVSKITTLYLQQNYEISFYYLEWLTIYGSVSALVSAISIALFNLSEVRVRIFQLLFYIGASIYTFKLINLYKDKKIALIATALVLFFPCTFFFGHTALLVSGDLFFLVISLYYFLKYNKENQFKDLAFFSFFSGLAFIYNRVTLIIFFIIWGYLGLNYLLEYKNINIFKFLKNSFIYVKATFAAFIILIPWYFIMDKWRDVRKFFFSIDNWKDIDIATSYLRLIPEQVTWGVAILLIFGFIYGIYKVLKEKDKLSLLSISWILMYYILFTSERFTGFQRYTEPFLPAIAILVISFMYDLFKKFNLKKSKNIIYVILLIYVASTTIYLTYSHWEDRYPPINQMVAYVKENIPADARILRTMQPNAYNFYIEKYNAPQYFKHFIWEPDYKKQNISNLHEYLVKNNFTYVIFLKPEKVHYVYKAEKNVDWYSKYNNMSDPKGGFSPIINHDLIMELRNMTSGPFILNKTIISGKNEIFISEVNYSYKGDEK